MILQQYSEQSNAIDIDLKMSDNNNLTTQLQVLGSI